MHVQSVNYTHINAPDLFSQSLKDTGFVVLNNHPIAKDLIDQVYQGWQTFFNSDRKFDFTYQKPQQDGYFPFKTENAKNSKISDLKEFFHFYPWGKIPAELKDSTETIFAALKTLAAELLQWVEDHLPDETAQQLAMPLKNMIQQSRNTLLRILHYPPLTQDAEKEAIRAAPHEDINFLTLLPAATAPGLEVLDIAGNWHAVSCDPGNIVINAGDMLQMCTRQYYKSTTHRVVNPTDESKNCSRFSMPLFLHAREEIRISEQYTVGEYLHERLRQIGIY